MKHVYRRNSSFRCYSYFGEHLFYDLEFILLNFRVEIDFNENFDSYRDRSNLKFKRFFLVEARGIEIVAAVFGGCQEWK